MEANRAIKLISEISSMQGICTTLSIRRNTSCELLKVRKKAKSIERDDKKSIKITFADRG